MDLTSLCSSVSCNGLCWGRLTVVVQTDLLVCTLPRVTEKNLIQRFLYFLVLINLLNNKVS